MIAEAADVRRLYAAKAASELRDADKLLGARVVVSGTGDPVGRVLLLKGEPGERDTAARAAFAGPDGDAARKAVEALGYDPSHSWMTCSRPIPGRPGDDYARRLRIIVEAVDPALVIALDDVAALDLAASAGLPALRPGEPRQVMGRTIGATESLAASLSDTKAKARVWRQMRSVAAAAAPKPGGGAESSGKTKERP